MAKQMILSFDVENQTLKRKDENKIVEKSKNYVHAIFFFTEEWDDTQKAAIIENGGMRFKVYLENNECDIPNRAVSHDGFTITIVGEDEEKNITITTTDLFIAVQKNNASDIQEEYIKNITSDTLDLTRNGENCNIEIPSEYVTDEKLLQKLENYVDNESLEETLDDYAKETDLSIYATKQELNEKSKVVANPTLSGNEETLEGAEIDGIKYKVGGGEVHLYRHLLRFEDDTYIEIYTSNSTPLTMNLLKENYQGRYFANRDFNVLQSNYASIARYVKIELSRVRVSYFEINLSTNTMNLSYGDFGSNPVDTITQIF